MLILFALSKKTYLLSDAFKISKKISRKFSLEYNQMNYYNCEQSLSQNTIIIITGPTAVGKSAVAREICYKLKKAEIVITDSVQVYKYMNIGSNKPSNEEMLEIPHHMVDIVEPNEMMSSGDFVRQITPIIHDILGRGNVPVLVGGSTMWVQWLVHGIPDAPKADPSTALEAEKLLKKFKDAGDWTSAAQFVSNYDHRRVATLPGNDWYRLQRYLEIGLTLSLNGDQHLSRINSEIVENHNNSSPILSGIRNDILSDLDVRGFFISENRIELYRTIDRRCEEMLECFTQNLPIPFSSKTTEFNTSSFMKRMVFSNPDICSTSAQEGTELRFEELNTYTASSNFF
jgi:tRNA dimethylallyltransferase